MIQVLIHHKVEDFAKWKPAYDAHSETRVRAGSRAYRLLRNVGDPNDIFILFDWENEARAREFLESEDLKDKMKEAGVTSEPALYLMEEIESRAEGIGRLLSPK